MLIWSSITIAPLVENLWNMERNVKDTNNDGSCSDKLGELVFGKDKESAREGRGFEFVKIKGQSGLGDSHDEPKHSRGWRGDPTHKRWRDGLATWK